KRRAVEARANNGLNPEETMNTNDQPTAVQERPSRIPAMQPALPSADIMEKVLLKGDLSLLTPEERVSYYLRVCESVGLNPATQPFEYSTLQGKLTLYARKGCAEQLRKIYKISLKITKRELGSDGIYT